MKIFKLVLCLFVLSHYAFGNQSKMNSFTSKTKLMFPDSYKQQSLKHIPLEMAQFYLAMGVSEYWHCVQKDEPQSCTDYLQMMSDPISHLGFVFFMITSRSVTEMGIKSKITAPFASYLGLASGLLVQTVFEEIYRHPNMETYLNSRYIEDPVQRTKIRKEALSELYETTFGSQEWYIEKFPLVSSLLLAAGFSPMIVKSAYTVSAGSYGLLKKIIGAKKFQKFDKFQIFLVQIYFLLLKFY